MKIKCSRDLLHESVNNVLKAASAKSSMPALEGILLKTGVSDLTLTGYDLEIGITQTIECDVQTQGEIVLNAKVLSDMVRSIDGENIIIEKTDDFIVNISSGNTQYTILGISSEDFPALPVAQNNLKVVISQNNLKSMIKKTIFAVSQDQSKPVLTGVLFEIKDGVLTTVSCDGCRLCVCKENINYNGEEKTVIPSKTLNEILKMLKDEDDETIEITFDKKHISFKFNDCTVISRLLEGQFIDYNAVIPKEIKTTVSVQTKKIQKTIERTSLILSDKLKSSIKIIFEDNKIKASCKTALGNASDEIDAAIEGESCTIGFNSKYILDSLKACEEENIIIQFNGSVSPMKITAAQGSKQNDFLFLVMPVML
ncbi:MAG: DNA polymerase III subunit beta [Oscillospiraceae bacterium]